MLDGNGRPAQIRRMPVTSRARRKPAQPDAYFNGFATGVTVTILGCVLIVAIAALV